MSIRDFRSDHLGPDPIETFTRIHGVPPPGTPRRKRATWVPVAQWEREGREMAEREQAEREAAKKARAEAEERERAEAEAKATAEQNPPRACLGEVAAAPAADEGGGAEAGASDASSALESPTTTEAAPLRSPSPSDLGEDLEKPGLMRLSGPPELQEWLASHWQAITAMAEAGRLSELESALTSGEAPPAPPPPPPPPLPPVHVRKGDRWNKPKMVEFLRQLAATHSVSAAAKLVGMSRESAYRLRNRLKGQPFDIAWEAAFRQGYDNLAHAALDRAINGVEVPHYANGELVGTSRKYDERLTVALLAMRNRYGAPKMGRYGAAAEWWSERWDAMLERVGTGSIDWRDETGPEGVVLDGEKHIKALIDKHAPDEGPAIVRQR